MASSRKIYENHSQLVFEKHSDWKLVIDLFFAQGICICYNANGQAKGQPEGVGSLLRLCRIQILVLGHQVLQQASFYTETSCQLLINNLNKNKDADVQINMQKLF